MYYNNIFNWLYLKINVSCSRANRKRLVGSTRDTKDLSSDYTHDDDRLLVIMYFDPRPWRKAANESSFARKPSTLGNAKIPRDKKKKKSAGKAHMNVNRKKISTRAWLGGSRIIIFCFNLLNEARLRWGQPMNEPGQAVQLVPDQARQQEIVCTYWPLPPCTAVYNNIV